MAETSKHLENPVLGALFSGLSDDSIDTKRARSIEEALVKIANPDYESLTSWRDSIVTFVKTHSKSTIKMLSHIGAHPTYRQITYFLSNLKPNFNEIQKCDIITTFDNEQKLKKSYRLGGAEGSNKMTTSLCTMVLHLYPSNRSDIQFQPSLSPANWLWNKVMRTSEYSKTFSQVLHSHKEKWWNRQIEEIFKAKEPTPKKAKLSERIAPKKVLNHRKLYDFAESNHPIKPADIDVGKPHDLNPASYEDTKKILREESIKAGISKYGSGSRSWLAFVCVGSPMRNFLSLFNVLFFCDLCKKPCGDLKKHVTELHEGKTNSIQMEFDHMLPLCGRAGLRRN